MAGGRPLDVYLAASPAPPFPMHIGKINRPMRSPSHPQHPGQGKEIQRLNGVYTSILKNAGVEQIEGRGVVLDPHTVEVRAADGSVRRLRTANILVATGGRAVKIPVEGKVCRAGGGFGGVSSCLGRHGMCLAGALECDPGVRASPPARQMPTPSP